MVSCQASRMLSNARISTAVIFLMIYCGAAFGCLFNEDCASYNHEGGKSFCCSWGCCNYDQYYSTPCNSVNSSVSACPGRYDTYYDYYCCEWGCCNSMQYHHDSCESLKSNCPTRHAKFANQTHCCPNNTCCTENEFYCPGGCDVKNKSQCCYWGCCSDAQYVMTLGGNCANDHENCPGRYDDIGLAFCCETKCCSEAEFTNKCSTNSDCPFSKDPENHKFCCEWGCCTAMQYYTTDICKYGDDCPGRNDTKNMTNCCSNNNQCCSENDFFCDFLTCNSTADSNKCCSWGCCNKDQFENTETGCTNSQECPGRYGNEKEKFCCKDGCCDEKDYLRGCKLNSDCSYSSYNTYCCDWGCCTYSQYYNYGTLPCRSSDQKCPGKHDNREDIYCCGDKCCANNSKCSTNSDCPGLYHRSDETYCCESGCCTVHEYQECFSNLQCRGFYAKKDQYLCCSDKRCCNSTRFCSENNCPRPGDPSSNKFCCKSGCCNEETYSNIGSCDNNNDKCPGRHDEYDKSYCCDTKCCTKDEFYLNAPCVPDIYGTSTDCDSMGFGYGSYEPYCCKHGCCSLSQYSNQGTCISSSDCPGYNDASNMYYCCKNKTCCRIDDNDYGYTSDSSSYSFPMGGIIALAVILKVGFWVLLCWLRHRRWTRDASCLLFNRRRTDRIILTTSDELETATESSTPPSSIEANVQSPTFPVVVNEEDTTAVQNPPIQNEQPPPSYDAVVSDPQETMPL